MIIPIWTCRRSLGLKDVFFLKGGRYPGVPEPEPEYLRVPGPAGQREPVPQLQRHTAVVSLRSRQGWFGVILDSSCSFISLMLEIQYYSQYCIGGR